MAGWDQHSGELQAVPVPAVRGEQQQASWETRREAGSNAVQNGRKAKIRMQMW